MYYFDPNKNNNKVYNYLYYFDNKFHEASQSGIFQKLERPITRKQAKPIEINGHVDAVKTKKIVNETKILKKKLK